MQLRIRTPQLDLPEETKTTIERKIRLTLGRHMARLDRTHVTLAPSDQATAAHRCYIRVRLRRGDTLTSQCHADDLHEAAAAAAWQLEHRLERHRFNHTIVARPHRRVGLRVEMSS